MSRIRINDDEFKELLDSGGQYEELESAPIPPVSPYLELAEALKATLAELSNRPVIPIEVEGMQQLMVDLQAMTLAMNRPTPIPVVQVAAPNVEIKPPSPSPRTWEGVVVRGADKLIVKIIFTALD